MTRIKTIIDVEAGLAELCKCDPNMASAHEFVSSAGIQVPLRLRPGGFGGLSEIVISQLVSKASANAIHQRFLENISPLSPEAYLNAGVEIWRKIGLSRPKQAALSAVATAMVTGEIDLDSLGTLEVETAMSQLTRIKGIGPWSAEVYLLFCVGHADIFPSGDLALREAARLIWSRNERPHEAELRDLAQQWSPWRGVAARLLWAYYAAAKSGREAIP